MPRVAYGKVVAIDISALGISPDLQPNMEGIRQGPDIEGKGEEINQDAEAKPGFSSSHLIAANLWTLLLPASVT